MTEKLVLSGVEMKKIQGRCSLTALHAAFDAILQPQRFKDYCPNGLQVEGKATIVKMVSGVTASLAFLEKAIEAKADALVVHHGYFFRGEDERVIGQKRKRLAALLKANVSLFAYHLPLDAHPTLGNNAQLGEVLGLPLSATFGPSNHGAELGMYADLKSTISTERFAEQIAAKLGRKPVVVGATSRPLRRIAWCTGAAQDMLQDAIDIDADAFISGEISERTTHLAREMGIVYFAAGHHATERYGVQALGQEIALNLGITHEFIDDDNPA
jgi:dinuclear metal center YbgI/SA1388 family protein